jgi:hypothetical protein
LRGVVRRVGKAVEILLELQDLGLEMLEHTVQDSSQSV